MGETLIDSTLQDRSEPAAGAVRRIDEHGSSK
jgi:hypothetical protein